MYQIHIPYPRGHLLPRTTGMQACSCKLNEGGDAGGDVKLMGGTHREISELLSL